MGSLNTYLPLNTQPMAWSAAHYPVEFTGVPINSVLSVVADNSGFAQFTINIVFLPLAVGQLVYVGSGVYQGWHTIKTIQSTTLFTTTTAFTSTISAVANIIYFPVLEFDLYVGYKPLEEYPSQLPYTLIATFKVEPNVKTFSYKWDVSGFLKSIFSIVPPAAGIDFNLFNRFRLVYNGDELENYQVANAAFENPAFNLIFANAGQPLNTAQTIYFNCGETINSIIEGGIIRTYVNDGCIVEGFNGNDFDNDDFIINICS